MICLINMPFASLINPNLALSQFKAQLSMAGLNTRLLNLNFDFASEIGIKDYEAFARRRGVDTQIGEWFFAKYAWDGAVDLPPETFIGLCGVNPAYFARIKEPGAWMQKVRDEVVPGFIEKCCSRIFEADPEVVAFSCTFYQTISSLALAKAVKAKRPDTRVVFGGACFHGCMGWEIFRKLSWIDAVSLGEADDVIIDLFKKLAEGSPPSGLQGICYRGNDREPVRGPEHTPISSSVLESIPDPDFDDYMRDLKRCGLADDPKALDRIFLPFESSRGCWWGEKKHCTFCGLNAESLVYRKKSAKRMRRLFEGYLARYPVKRFFATDNNMPRQYLKDLFPDLARAPLSGSPQFFWEVKTNLSREEMQVLSASGVKYTQPGIESLSTPLLELMRKGCTALQNLHYLKLCRTLFVLPMWNFLVSIPGERIEDYEEQAELIPKIVHFNPPYAGIRLMQLHRFSPYFDEKETYVSGIRPKMWYEGLFPKEEVDIGEVAYYFDADWKQVIGRTDKDYLMILKPIEEWINTWKNAPVLPGLCYNALEIGGLELQDTRFGKNGIWRLNDEEARVYRSIEDPASLSCIEASLGDGEHSSSWLSGILDEFVKHGIAYEDGGRYLGLALPDSSPALSVDYRKVFLHQEEKLIKDELE